MSDEALTEQIKIRLTAQQNAALIRVAKQRERKPATMARLIISGELTELGELQPHSTAATPEGK